MKEYLISLLILAIIPLCSFSQFQEGSGDGYASALFVVNPSLPIGEPTTETQPEEDIIHTTSLVPNPVRKEAPGN